MAEIRRIEVEGSACSFVELIVPTQASEHFLVTFVSDVPDNGYTREERLFCGTTFLTEEEAVGYAKAKLEQWGCSLVDEEDEPEDFDDGDHASALASCGFGTDEDYGSYDCCDPYDCEYDCE